MSAGTALSTWADFFSLYPAADGELFSASCVKCLGPQPWVVTTDDRKAAGLLHVQLVSRITTQPLGYTTGIEQAALESVYTLFEKTREITAGCLDGRHFELLAWDVLNERVRPFTAKWHRESVRGQLAALDATDEFRADLAGLQTNLRQFDRALCHLRDLAPPLRAQADFSTERERRISAEMQLPLEWGIPPIRGHIDAAQADALNAAERKAIQTRRAHYGRPTGITHATGLALSGGGIRSATFSLGVLVALARRGLLPHFDYLSTVSGGGYLGSFLSTFLHEPATHLQPVGLRSHESPFSREAGESAPLRYLRQNCRYLSSWAKGARMRMAAAQLSGMLFNGLGIMWVAFVVACGELVLRGAGLTSPSWPVLLSALGFSALGSLVIMRLWPEHHKIADGLFAAVGIGLLVCLLWQGLDLLHGAFGKNWDPGHPDSRQQIILWLFILGCIPLAGSAILGIFGRFLGHRGWFLASWTALAALAFFAGLYLLAYNFASGIAGLIAIIILVASTLVYHFLFNVNVTSPHRHYRDRLAGTFLIKPSAEGAASGVRIQDDLLLSELGEGNPRAPYHLINCALNVPASKQPAMQGRLTDFFLFSANFCGSPLTGYAATTEWERADRHLNLGTAMAISGAAASPQMGFGTIKQLSFWLALLNVRLGYWVRKPKTSAWWRHGPGLGYLYREMTGRIDERQPWLNVTDGGHIENLGVYELLRRRCQYIVAVDGEQDSHMTFGALTTLQRLAAIDLGVRIDLDLDDLRLNPQGLSRSHFHFARIHYPDVGGEKYGYLLYVKLSLTGNEGEFIRRYRRDEPVFPHHSTSDQFFTDAQFEAYRSLGEHVGEKLFLKALVGDRSTATDWSLEEWFLALGKNLLEPLPLPSK